jgi:hypothetical protein
MFKGFRLLSSPTKDFATLVGNLRDPVKLAAT